MALFEKPVFLLLMLLLVGGFTVLVVSLALAGSRRGSSAAPPAATASDAPMTLHAGRWLRWDGTQWRDVETGSPVIDESAPQG
jgi:hypothetical protein